MSFLLDTDTCSFYLRGDRRVHARFIQYNGGLYLSTVSLAELSVWAHRGGARRLVGLREMVGIMAVLPVSIDVADTYGRVVAAMLNAGTPAPKHDMLIAATALHHDLTLVTHNTADFANVPGLRVVDWTL